MLLILHILILNLIILRYTRRSIGRELNSSSSNIG